jgi:ATP-dependent DNA helicase Q1
MYHEDVTLQAWQILKIVDAVDRQHGSLTLSGLADLARGNGGGAFTTSTRGRKGQSKEKVDLDLDEVAGGKVALNKDVRLNTFIKCYLNNLVD